MSRLEFLTPVTTFSERQAARLLQEQVREIAKAMALPHLVKAREEMVLARRFASAWAEIEKLRPR